MSEAESINMRFQNRPGGRVYEHAMRPVNRKEQKELREARRKSLTVDNRAYKGQPDRPDVPESTSEAGD